MKVTENPLVQSLVRGNNSVCFLQQQQNRTTINYNLLLELRLSIWINAFQYLAQYLLQATCSKVYNWFTTIDYQSVVLLLLFASDIYLFSKQITN